jgi:hypothetical protein
MGVILGIWLLDVPRNAIRCFFGAAESSQNVELVTTTGVAYLMDAYADEEIEDLLRWEIEIQSPGLTAMIKASSRIPETYPQIFKRLAEHFRIRHARS